MGDDNGRDVAVPRCGFGRDRVRVPVSVATLVFTSDARLHVAQDFHGIVFCLAGLRCNLFVLHLMALHDLGIRIEENETRGCRPDKGISD